MVWVAAVLALVAPAAPAWRSEGGGGAGGAAAARPWAQMAWAVRGVAGGDGGATAAAWVRLVDAGGPLDRLTVSIASGVAVPFEQTKPLADWRAGVALPVPADADRVALAVAAAGEGRPQPLAAQVFVRPASRPFALLTAGPRAAVDPAVERVFAIAPGARPGDPTVRPAVVLAAAPDAGAAAVREAGPGGLVVALPDVALPGLTAGPRHAAPGDALWTPELAAGGPAFVRLEHVRVTALREAAVGPPWRVLATAGGWPWIAARPATADGPAMIWLASVPSAETDWPKDPSFVLFFADHMSRLESAADAGGRFIDWLPEGEGHNGPPPAPVLTDTPLSAAVGAAAVGLLAAAVGLLHSRARGL
jgi:hypothetical protein